jgi:energy-coupling factor transport system ATP-binding protein
VTFDRFGYRYPEAARAALAGLSLELEAGSFTVLAGGSGSGKSTLLRACSGLVPHFHGGDAEGRLEVCGLSVRDNGPGELADACGTLFQDPETQVVMGGVQAEIALPLEQRGAGEAEVARAVEEVALTLGVADLLERRTESLSGGELQRVALAAALVHRPALLLLDEPTSQLDPVAGDELIWLLRRLNEEWGTAVLVAEHRLERCLAAADRVLVLEEGAVACDGSPREFLEWAAGSAAALMTPAARLFAHAGLRPLPASVKQARAALRVAGLVPEGADGGAAPRERTDSRYAGVSATSALRRRLGRRSRPALELRGVWHELRDGPAIMRGVDLRVEAGERVALLGRNGAGKSTLLRHAKGLLDPTRGRLETAGEVALLLQNPGDYLIHEHAGSEAGEAGLANAGLAGRGAANPRDLSGGERQRLALEVVLSSEPPAVVCLDEPTRGMDRGWKAGLGERIAALAADGAAVIVATHDTEFAAEFATRVVLLGKGTVIADGTPAEVLAGGWHFSTEVSRTLDGEAGALTPEQGARVLERELVSSGPGRPRRAEEAAR